MEPTHISIIVGVLAFTLTSAIQLFMAARWSGRIGANIEELIGAIGKLERSIEKLFDRTTEHGNRIAVLETRHQREERERVSRHG